jgi:hypothetical protein
MKQLSRKLQDLTRVPYKPVTYVWDLLGRRVLIGSSKFGRDVFNLKAPAVLNPLYNRYANNAPKSDVFYS